MYKKKRKNYNLSDTQLSPKFTVIPIILNSIYYYNPFIFNFLLR